MEELEYDLFGARTVAPRVIDADVAEGVMHNVISELTCEGVAGMLYSPIQAVDDFMALCEGENTCTWLSVLFNPHRLSTAAKGRRSIVEALSWPPMAKGLLRILRYLRNDGNPLRRGLQMSVNGAQYISDFRPYLARDLYSHYHAHRILDPCAGWGGRMIGAAAVGAHYHGFEPSARTHRGLCQLGTWLQGFRTGFTFQLDCMPFEDTQLSDSYDVAFTSPPYYDAEGYDSHISQAAVRYADFNEFSEHFLGALITRATQACTSGLILNVGDRTYPMSSSVKAICQRQGFSCQLYDGPGSFTTAGGFGKCDTGGEVFYVISAGEVAR